MLWIPVQTLRAALRVEVQDDDPELARLCQAARAYVEGETGRSMDVVTAYAYAADFSRPLTLPYLPLAGITSVTYTDLDGNANQTLASTHYRTSYLHGPLPVLEFLDTVPEEASPGTVLVTLTHGYTLVPWDLIQVGVSLVAHWYGNVEASAPVLLSKIPFGVEVILARYKIREVMR